MKTSPLLIAVLTVPIWAGPNSAKPGAIDWQPWSDAIFDQAKRENKFVLLDLEAVWCHWCHVMDETTYKTPEVIALIQSKYIPVRVDQDSRPDLSNRYEDYGWPATIVFGPAGGEIAKRQGYIEPRQMIAMLKAIIADPTPGPSVRPEAAITYPSSAALTGDLRAELERRYFGQYDSKHGSWGFDQKFLDWTSTEYAMTRAHSGDAKSGEMARQSLNAQFNLIDRVWGGVYQYSVGGDWNEPHFEKIMNFQAGNLRIYSLAYEEWHDPAYLKAAEDVHRFLKTFLLSPDGAFYTSMNADLIDGKHSAAYFKLDDAGRRKLGIPRIDKHMYSRENGWAIDAVATLYAATGDPQYLDEVTRAANWILQNRPLDGGGGFRHDTKDAAGPYLADTLTMARAFLTIYEVTGDRAWLAHSESAAKFINANFADAHAGFITSKAPTDRSYTPHPEREENILLARFTNLLSRYTGNSEYRAMSEQAMRYLAAPEIAKYLPTGGTLLADRELSTDPIHITIVGHKDDPAAQALFHTAASYPSGYLRLEWWDTREGRLPNPDVQYPELKSAAAFICTGNTCSSPIYKPEAIRAKADKLTRPQPGS